MNFETLQANVLQWSKHRQIIPNSTAQAQFMKAVSEMGELSDAIMKGRKGEASDALGDVLVCLINTAALLEIDLVQALAGAWDEIKDRKGTMLPGGIFVKEGDAPKA